MVNASQWHVYQPSQASSCSNPFAQSCSGSRNLRLSGTAAVPKVHLKIRQQAEKFPLASCVDCSSLTQRLQREWLTITCKRPWTSEEWCRSHRAVEKSQNHRSVRVKKDLWRSSSPMPLPWQGHPEEVTQECIQVGFECLQRGHSTTSLGHSVLWHPQCKGAWTMRQMLKSVHREKLKQILKMLWKTAIYK